MMIVAFSLCLSVSLALAVTRKEYSVFWDHNKFTYKPGIDKSAVSYGWVEDTVLNIGWDTLQITSNPSNTDNVQAFAAGYLEGLLTSEKIEVRFVERNSSRHHSHHHRHAEPGICRGAVPEVEMSITFMDEMVKKNPHDAYWHQVSLVLEQTKGLLTAYNELTPRTQMNFTEFVCMQSGVELYDYIKSRPGYRFPDFAKMTQKQWNRWFMKNQHCSSLIKVSSDLSELYFGHSTWSGYHSMGRQMKTYSLAYDKKTGNSGDTVIFSGYPGTIPSIDDFYMVSSGLVVIETTIGNYNSTLYKEFVRPDEQVPYWVRISVANRMSRSGREWSDIFSRYNSGTYCNQWIVVDTNKFQPGQPVAPDTLWILEQLPGFVEAADESRVLQFGYWPSYNVPYFKDVYSIGNFTPQGIAQPHDLSYQLASRAEIFRRDEASAGKSFTAYKEMLRYNDYMVDPLSMKNPGYAIASRFDLANGTTAQCFGAIDTKASSYSLFKQGMTVHAINGPTRSHGLPAFAWATTKANCNNAGKMKYMPPVFDFEFEQFKPDPM